MKKFLSTLGVVAVAGLPLAACGSMTTASVKKADANPQVQREQAKAEKILQNCAPAHVTVLLSSHGARTQYVACVKQAVPPAQRAAFEQCITKGLVTGHLPTKARVKSVALNCVGQVKTR